MENVLSASHGGHCFKLLTLGCDRPAGQVVHLPFAEYARGGQAVGLVVGLAVGLTVGDTLGLAVGLTVGVDVGEVVGLAVGLAVGALDVGALDVGALVVHDGQVGLAVGLSVSLHAPSGKTPETMGECFP